VAKPSPGPFGYGRAIHWQAAAWNLVETFDPALLPPMRAGFGCDSFSRYLLLREHWQHLRRQYDAQGEKLVPYSCRHGYDDRAHVICDLAPKVAAAAMGHSVQTHLATYSRWCGDDVVEDAFARAERRLGGGGGVDHQR
jgi:hypothetical protein